MYVYQALIRTTAHAKRKPLYVDALLYKPPSQRLVSLSFVSMQPEKETLEDKAIMKCRKVVNPDSQSCWK